jgi:hypothetical protein
MTGASDVNSSPVPQVCSSYLVAVLTSVSVLLLLKKVTARENRDHVELNCFMQRLFLN